MARKKSEKEQEFKEERGRRKAEPRIVRVEMEPDENGKEVHESARVALLNLYERDGQLTPEEVLEAAKPEDSPLHPYFTWDNAQAADKQRMNEATRLIRRFRIVIKPMASTTRQYRFVPSKKAYFSHETIVSNNEMLVEIKRIMLDDLVRIIKRNQTFFASYGDELGPVHQALRDAEAMLRTEHEERKRIA